MREILRFKAFIPVIAGVIFFSTAAIAQIDSDASAKTAILYENLKNIQNSNQFLFGQEFFNSFRFSSGSAHGDKEYSDSKTVTGSHPAVLGSDFHYYLTKTTAEKGYHTEAVKWAYKQGYVITFDWHLSGRGTDTYEYRTETKDLVNNIVNDLNGDRTWYYSELDKVINIINNDLVVGTEKIPIVFRPLHEMNGDWFWWGSKATTATNYVALYRLLVNYVKERTNTVLFCWSPNTPTNFNYYPGDDYVDVLGVDAYEVNASSVRSQLAPIVDHAQAHGKVAVFSETGYRSNSGTTMGDNARAAYWKNTILPAIMEDPAGRAQKIAWVLTWINASWSVPYIPHGSSGQEAKQNFIDFKNSLNVLFGGEAPNMYTLIPVVAVEGNVHETANIKLFPMPVNDQLSISLSGFERLSKACIYDTKGKLIHELKITDGEAVLNANEILNAGVYILKASDSKKTLTKKLLVD